MMNFSAANRLRENAVDAAPLDLLPHQTDTDENRHQQPESPNRTQTKVDQDDLLDAHGDAAEKDRGANQQQREYNQVVQNPLAHGLLKGVQRDAGNAPHCTPRSRSGSVTACPLCDAFGVAPVWARK